MVKGYLTANYDAKNINRQFIADNDYTGIANSENDKNLMIMPIMLL